MKKKTKVKIIILGIIILIILILYLSGLLIHAPIIHVKNILPERCNQYVTNYNGTYYYYSSEPESGIYKLNDNGEPTFICKTNEISAITCNDNFIYYYSFGILYQITVDGELQQKTSNDNFIEYLYASNDILYCNTGGSVFLFNANNISKQLDPSNYFNTEDIGCGEVSNTYKTYYQIHKRENVSIAGIENDFPDLCEDEIPGVLIDNKSSNTLAIDLGHQIFGYKDGTLYKYTGFGNVMKITESGASDLNMFSSSSVNLDNVRIINDNIVAIGRNYKIEGKLLIKTLLFIRNFPESIRIKKGTPTLHQPDHELIYHGYDNIYIGDINSGEITKLIKTRKGERVIYTDLEKALKYYKGEIYTYNIDNWKVVKKEDASYIKNNGLYEFITCGKKIFVYQDKKIINIIDIT